MKHLTLLTIVFSWALASWANDPYCSRGFEKAVDNLETVYKNLQDPLIGDIAYPKYQATEVGPTTGDSYTKQIFVPHQNIHGQVWFNEYEVALTKSTCLVEKFAFKGASAKKECVNNVTAKANLEKHLKALVDTIPLSDFPWLDEESATSVLSSSLVAEALNTLHLSQRVGHYTSEALYNQECAAAADCWGWYEVRCDGQVEAVTDGD